MSFGNLSNTTPVFELPRNTSARSSAPTSSYTSYASSTEWINRLGRRRSLWSRFNEGVAGLGNWFAEKAGSVLGWAGLLVMVGLIISGIVVVISAWATDGFWVALLATVGVLIGGCLLWFVASVVIYFVVNAIMYGLRLIFWNGWSLLTVLALCLGIWGYTAYGPRHDSAPLQTEAYTPTYPVYRCTAQVLNIRIQPNSRSRVVGTLSKGQEVQVIDTENGFAAIDYNGDRRYVSLKYLTQVN